MPNPFFSGRIPPDLHQCIEQHIIKTKESKTQVLINALAAYLNHPLAIQETPSSSGVSVAMFTALEERVTALERLLQTSEKVVINEDSNKLSSQNIIISSANFDNLTDPWLDETTQTVQTKIDNTDNNTRDGVIKSPILSLALAPAKITLNQADNAGNEKKLQDFHSEYGLLTSAELCKLANIKRTQIDFQKRKLNKKDEKTGRAFEKQLLKSPKKIEMKDPLTINSYPHHLFYAGQNEKGNDLWMVFPCDNSSYQQLSINALNRQEIQKENH